MTNAGIAYCAQLNIFLFKAIQELTSSIKTDAMELLATAVGWHGPSNRFGISGNSFLQLLAEVGLRASPMAAGLQYVVIIVIVLEISKS